MVQFVQLQKNLAAFHEAGIEVVALTYDDPSLQQLFIDKNGIEYAFLSDIDAYSVKALGILNEGYEPGDGAYGIPHPFICFASYINHPPKADGGKQNTLS
jgi:peroxiredoxin